jgi:hypothetical protein
MLAEDEQQKKEAEKSLQLAAHSNPVSDFSSTVSTPKKGKFVVDIYSFITHFSFRHACRWFQKSRFGDARH